MKIPVLVLIFCSSLFWLSCNIVNPAEKIPTYIQIDSFQFVPTNNTGSSSHKITSAWVYFDNQTVGVFDLPATVPILAESKGVVLVIPGVTFSGINNIQTQYPYYLSDTLTIVPGVGKVVNFIPETKYLADTILNSVIVDFETGVGFNRVIGDTEIVVVEDPNLVFEGSKSGYIYLDNKSYSENIMLQGFSDPRAESFLEMDYKCSLPFEVGLQTTNATGQLFTQYIYGFKPRTTWNKVYMGFNEFVSAFPNKQYRVVIRVGSLGGDPVTGFVSLDNIKVFTKR